VIRLFSFLLLFEGEKTVPLSSGHIRERLLPLPFPSPLEVEVLCLFPSVSRDEGSPSPFFSKEELILSLPGLFSFLAEFLARVSSPEFFFR